MHFLVALLFPILAASKPLDNKFFRKISGRKFKVKLKKKERVASASVRFERDDATGLVIASFKIETGKRVEAPKVKYESPWLHAVKREDESGEFLEFHPVKKDSRKFEDFVNHVAGDIYLERHFKAMLSDDGNGKPRAEILIGKVGGKHIFIPIPL